MKKLAIISLSGGLDSSTLALKALEEGYDIFTLGFKYGQKNSPELLARQNVLSFIKSKYPNQFIDDQLIDAESLMSQFFKIYKDLRDSQKIKDETSHEFYTPSRNLLFSVLSTVVGEIIALAKDYDEVNIGLGIHKHSEEAYGKQKDYWDITPEFAEKLSALLSLNDVKDIKLFTPYVEKTKSDIVEDAIKMGLDLSLTWTCYDPLVEIIQEENSRLIVYRPCRNCEACVERDLAGKRIKNGVILTINDYFVSERINDD